MKPELLYKMADIINANSTKYRAIIPCAKHDYMIQQGNKLVKSGCLVLRIMISGKIKSHVNRTVWNIYPSSG